LRQLFSIAHNRQAHFAFVDNKRQPVRPLEAGGHFCELLHRFLILGLDVKCGRDAASKRRQAAQVVCHPPQLCLGLGLVCLCEHLLLDEERSQESEG
jgi:hypothetical protein